uniref:Uncharacterized protein LOC114329941 n=1 Tax=Diabrotica virgifera virgifera TaxID=50390 RepID=A0A6P7FG48_DIAVI
MNVLPASNGPGDSYSQPVSQTNIQGVADTNMQVQQFINSQPITQAALNNNNSCLSQQHFDASQANSTQQVPINQQNYIHQVPMIQKSQHIPSTSQKYYHRLSSTSDDEQLEQHAANENEWQQVTNTKRRKIRRSNSQNSDIDISNRYSQLPVEETVEESQTDQQIDITEAKTIKPPPIFAYGVTD